MFKLLSLMYIIGSAVQAKINPSVVRLGTLMPTTGSFGASGQKAVIMAQLAVEDVVANNILNNTSLQLVPNNTAGIGNTAAKLAAWQVQNGAAALFGGVISGETLPISFLATSAHIPNINPSAASPDFSDKTAHEYHIRTIPSDEKIGAGLLAMAAHYQWEAMALMNGDDAFGRGMNDYLIKAKPPSLQLLRYPFAVPPAVTEAVMIPLLQANLQAIRSSGVRVVILHMQAAVTKAVLNVVRASGMLGSYVFLGTGWCTPATLATANWTATELAALNGLTCSTTHTPNVASLTARAKAKSATLFAAGLTARELASYDGVLAFATAVANMHRNDSVPNSGPQLLKELKALNIEGSLGRIRFDAKGDLLSLIDVINYQNGQFVVRGTWDESSGQLTMESANIWPDGTTNVPRAIPKDYYDGDSIRATWDPRIIVTAVAISILGSFTASILLEQAMPRPNKQKHSAKTNHQEGGWYRLAWILTAAIAVGGGSIWCSVFIELSGLTIGPITPRFHPSVSLLAIPTAILMVFLGLYIAFPARATLPAPKCNGDNNRVITITVSEHGDASTNKKPSLLPTNLSRWTFVGGLMVAAGILVVESLCLEALDLQATFTTNVGLIIASILVVMVTSCATTVLFFHVKSAWRLTSSPIFTIGVFASLHLMFVARSYVYRPLQPQASNSWSTENLTIICAATATALVIALLLLNVTRLKNTRNQLDLHLAKAQVELAKMERDLDASRAETQTVLSQLSEKEQALELVNSCRPLYRTHAIAYAMTPYISALDAPTKRTFDERALARNIDVLAGVNLQTGPVSYLALQEIGLKEIMLNPATVEFLKDSLRDARVTENAAFLMDVQRYKRLERHSVRAIFGQEIYNTYIVADSPHEINISAGLKAQVKDNLAKKATKEAFDPVETEILSLIRTNQWEAFTTSPQFKLCCLILGHSSYKLQPRASETTATRQSGTKSSKEEQKSETTPQVPGEPSPHVTKKEMRPAPVGSSSIRETSRQQSSLNTSQDTKHKSY